MKTIKHITWMIAFAAIPYPVFGQATAEQLIAACGKLQRQSDRSKCLEEVIKRNLTVTQVPAPAPPDILPAQPATPDLTVVVGKSSWNMLSTAQRTALESKGHPRIVADEAYGVIADSQTLNSSDPGTNGGTILGAMVGSAAYFDHTSNYSAMASLGAGVLGALIGSTLDRPATTSYSIRYTVRTLDGQLKILDDTTLGFHLPIGSCIDVAALSLTDQHICSGEPFRQEAVSSQEQLVADVQEPSAGLDECAAFFNERKKNVYLAPPPACQ